MHNAPAEHEELEDAMAVRHLLFSEIEDDAHRVEQGAADKEVAARTRGWADELERPSLKELVRPPRFERGTLSSGVLGRLRKHPIGA